MEQQPDCSMFYFVESLLLLLLFSCFYSFQSHPITNPTHTKSHQTNTSYLCFLFLVNILLLFFILLLFLLINSNVISITTNFAIESFLSFVQPISTLPVFVPNSLSSSLHGGPHAITISPIFTVSCSITITTTAHH